MQGIFITGTDTNVGKTILSAGFLKMLHGGRAVKYWKPIQTGTIVGDDTNDIKALTDIPDTGFLEPAYRFPDPLSPHMAAKKWGRAVDTAKIMDVFNTEKKNGTFLVVEGAGGLMVPLNDTELQIHLMKKMGLPLVIVSQDRVGAINQCLLTLKACAENQIPVLGIVLTRGRGNLGNAEAISRFGGVEVLAEFPPVEDLKSLLAQVSGHARLRKLVNLPVLP